MYSSSDVIVSLDKASEVVVVKAPVYSADVSGDAEVSREGFGIGDAVLVKNPETNVSTS